MFTTGIYLLYRLCLIAATPLIILYLLVRAARQPGYLSTLKERWGRLPPSYRQTSPGAIWLHAVSVGEVLSAIELLKRLRLEIPVAPLYVSVGTLAGRAIADEKLGSLVDGVFFAPLDFVYVVRRVLRRLRPAVVVVAETEIWPNLLREVKRAGCGLVMVNARVSDRAAPSYRRWRWFFRHALRWPDAILAQTGAIRGRFISAGAPPEKVFVGGNLKYDFRPGCPAPAVAGYLDGLQPGAIWVAASTMPPDEDDMVIAAFGKLAKDHKDLLLILAPRKPELFGEAARKLEQAGVRFARRSSLNGPPPSLPGVLLLDSMGELSGIFSRADVVFMGGSIVPRGGHNILEPAMFGKPIVVGPHMENFQEIADSFRKAGALVEIESGAELGTAVDALLRDRERAAKIGGRARRCSEAERGATGRAVDQIVRLYADAAPRFAPALPVRAAMGIWHSAAAVARLYRTSRRKKLRAPVISVGNLTVGGSGKTPMTLYLAGRLSKPAILTRGYRRQSTANRILSAGQTAPWTETGDEAQIFLRSGLAPVGIGADRVETGRAVESRFEVEHFILDDGFQHWRLHRSVDVVLVDSLDPFPAGRLREPMSALGRADVLVITRSGSRKPGIERELRTHNRNAPIFYSRVVPRAWVEGASGRRLELRDPCLARAAAFCGLANPRSFWTSLAETGVRPADRVAFPDHTRYDPRQIGMMLEKYGALLTTQKDWINLGGEAPAGIYWLDIGIEVENEEAFLRLVESRCAAWRLTRASV
ncbi:MAG TPA: tetraacyldisaccharide 4'-kinase [Bryobacteraceae bacterium]|nr:tetraacyldisaccharide 4'-kinase [Bryobacteraceae bacterium]